MLQACAGRGGTPALPANTGRRCNPVQDGDDATEKCLPQPVTRTFLQLIWYLVTSFVLLNLFSGQHYEHSIGHVHHPYSRESPRQISNIRWDKSSRIDRLCMLSLLASWLVGALVPPYLHFSLCPSFPPSVPPSLQPARASQPARQHCGGSSRKRLSPRLTSDPQN